jgi:hypothetical protein
MAIVEDGFVLIPARKIEQRILPDNKRQRHVRALLFTPGLRARKRQRAILLANHFARI